MFDTHESAVRVYCRLFPAVFARASGCEVWDDRGRRYLDFVCGAGALNYGHNHPQIKRRVLEYLEADGIVHGLDLHTPAKHDFIRDLIEIVLRPRGLDYKLQFTGPTGANAVEAAMKLARRSTGRASIVAFTNAFHGMSLGALAATGSRFKRGGAGLPLAGVTRMPFDGYLGPSIDTLALLERVLADAGSGVDIPAAILVETVQGEGGLAAAGLSWLRRLAELARRFEILFVVDDIQAGCGRTGRFFSFEEAGVQPDIVCLSKSLSGLGLPMSLVLHRPELDLQRPGEHSGTFRGNNLAFVAASAALELWTESSFEATIQERGLRLGAWIERQCERWPELGCAPRGRGLLRGLAFADPSFAKRVSRTAFESGLLVETSGAAGEVLKILPPISIQPEALDAGLALIDDAIATVGSAAT